MARHLAKGRLAKEARQITAKQRKLARDERTEKQQLARLDKLGHKAVKERIKLIGKHRKKLRAKQSKESKT